MYEETMEARLVRRARHGLARAIERRALVENERQRERQARAERVARKAYLAAIRGAEAWEA